ncbi:MAG TPA: DUF948 domain-containing protein [Actinomycetota bacterium]|nr:DUF948 domain-containing protein [Actinomycetota bacterium]
MVGSISVGGVAGLIAAVAWAVLVLVLGLVFVNLFRVLESTKMLIDGIREETVPLLSEVKTTVTGVNRELDRADGLLESVGNIAKSGERLAHVVEQAVSSPLIKVIAFGAGASRAVRRLKKDKKGE